MQYLDVVIRRLDMSESERLVDDVNDTVGCWDVTLENGEQHIRISHHDELLQTQNRSMTSNDRTNE